MGDFERNWCILLFCNPKVISGFSRKEIPFLYANDLNFLLILMPYLVTWLECEFFCIEGVKRKKNVKSLQVPGGLKKRNMNSFAKIF